MRTKNIITSRRREKRSTPPRFEVLETRAILSVSPGPIANWQLNELSGSAFDSAGGHNGAYVNSPALGKTGAAFDTGTAVAFNGTNQDVGIGNPSGLNFTGLISISAWIKPQSTSGVQEIIEHGDQASPGTPFVALCLVNGSYEIVSSNGSATNSAAATIPSTDLGTWVHLASVYNGTSWTLYRDGVQAAQTSSSVGAVAVSGNWAIAANGPGNSQFFQGNIQDVSIYSRSLSAAEVSVLAESDSPTLPYSSALASSALVQSPMASGIAGSMILGNGDLNGILWVNGGQLQFQIAKNDVADGVLNTSGDPALPTVNLQTGAYSGISGPSSWNYANPCPVIMGQVNISLGGSTLSSTLNVQNATATVSASGGSSLTAMVLQGQNVAEFDTSGTVSLAGCSLSYIPSNDTTSGTTNGIQWTTTTIPDNSDVPTMSYALAMATSGTRHVLAAVSSFESSNPLATAQQLAANALAASTAQLQATQATAWAHFWAKSGVQLGNASLQTQWYRNLYYSACANRPGAQPIGLCLGTTDINFTSLWHGIETTDYNMEQAFWGSYDTGHPELSEAYTQYFAAYEPVAQYYAQAVFGLAGAAYPHNQWVNENTNPAASTLNRHGMLAYGSYSLGLGLGGWILQNVWNSYLYNPDPNYLSTTVYPMMKQAAIFYAAALNACPKDGSGQAIYGPSYVEELGSYGVDDVTSDIGFTQLTLQAAIQAAQTLGVDSSTVNGWQQALSLLPPYPTASNSSGTVITDRLGDGATTAYNVAVPILPVFPAGVVSYFSPSVLRSEFLNAVQTINWGTANSVVMMAGAYARLAPAQTAYNFITNVFSQYQQANGVLVLNGIQGANFTESFATSGVISEMLLQSVGGIVRLFPSMPSSQNASFSNLGAQGGFTVSASQQNGSIGNVTVTATQAANFEFLSPWQYVTLTINGQSFTPTSNRNGVYTIPASAWSPSSAAGMQATIAQLLPTIVAPSANAYVRGGAFANQNYSSDVVLWVKNDSSASVDRQSYLTFNLTGIATPFRTVYLNLTPVYLGTDAAAMTLGVSLLPDASDNWGQNMLNWNNRPQGAGIVDTIAGSQLQVGLPISLDVTSLVEQAFNGNGLASFQISVSSGPDAAGYVEFAASNNGTAAWRPTLAIAPAYTAGPAAAAGTTIDGAFVAVTNAQSLGSTSDALTVQNGGSVDLGQSVQNVGTVTLRGGSISNGTVNASALDLASGTIGASLGGSAALLMNGAGTVVLSGANTYTGGTYVQEGVLVIASATAIPDESSLFVGDESLFASAGLALAKQQSAAAPLNQSTVSAAAIADPTIPELPTATSTSAANSSEVASSANIPLPIGQIAAKPEKCQ